MLDCDCEMSNVKRRDGPVGRLIKIFNKMICRGMACRRSRFTDAMPTMIYLLRGEQFVIRDTGYWGEVTSPLHRNGKFQNGQ